jgi:ribosomal protein L12E/L44/L45/RPP1/RPP2
MVKNIAGQKHCRSKTLLVKNIAGQNINSPKASGNRHKIAAAAAAAAVAVAAAAAAAATPRIEHEIFVILLIS